MKKSRFLRAFALVAVLALVLAACSSSDEEGAATTETPETTQAPGATAGGGEESEWGLPLIDPLDATSGDIGIAGSSTVFPLSTVVMAKWEDEGGPGYAIDSIGSGGGFERFCVEGASDISNASRPIKDEEVASCEGIGRTIIPIRIGTDALSLVVSKNNTFATELTFEEIGIAFSLPAGSTWADVNPDFPAHPLETYSPGADSGTFDFFFETIWPDVDDADGTPPILESGANIVGEDDNITVQGVAEDGCTEGDTSTSCAIGYFGFAFFQQNADKLNPVSIDAGEGEGYVTPGPASVNEGTYPIARPLYMYTAEQIVAEKPQVAQFIAYYLNNVNLVIDRVGYFPAPDDSLQEAADNIKAAAGW
ncbi:MAG: substrate-binding domain-containing protein [Actinomycetota bacterium]|nr:substrate-binding domain-containing protein [Actinomycetota bacterium]